SFPKVNYGTIPAGQWTVISIPMSQLNPNNLTIHRVDIQEVSGSTKTFYVDNLRLTGTVATPTAPTLASPANGTTDVAINPTLAWNTLLNASSYQVQVSASSTFSTTVVNQSAVTTTSLAVSDLMNDATYYWRVNATNSSGTSSWSGVASFTTVSAPDTTAPSVAFTAPTNGATVSGIINVSANASDDRSLVGVQFKLDGANVGTEVTNAPFSYSWNTSQVSNGSHTLTAVARDSAGNQTSVSATVSVLNVSNDMIVYQDAVQTPWINASWSATVTFNSTEQKNSGVASIKVVQKSWGALSLHHGSWGSSAGVDPLSYADFEFYVHGGPSGVSINVLLENDLGNSFPRVNGGSVPANTWKLISIPMNQLNPNRYAIHRFDILEVSGTSKTYFVDDIRFVGGSQTAAKSHSDGTFTGKDELPSSFNLSQNFPNPFNPTTRISYALPEVASVTVEVFNAIGQSVAVLQSGQQQAGAHQVEFSASGLATGIYFYRLTALSADGQKNLFVKTRKMLLTK
ncbi:MAG: T9SS type A sorting domain-containing protein, partial [Ignavibacteriales bacterium]|nr:T9SS type A sorting domain-containing protein [Ignavibacteriales bacterium]